MHINLYLIPFVIIAGLFLAQENTKRNKLVYIVLCSLLLLFVAAMRSPEWMTFTYNIDTLNYKDTFESTFYMSWDEFWASVYERYWKGEGDSDIGYLAINKLIGLFTHEFSIFSLLADLLFFIPFGMLLYHYCSNILQVMFGYVFYIALVQVFFLGGARQMFALGFDLMALIAMIDKKRLWTAVFLLMAISIHFSSILFLIPLLMVWYNFSSKTLKWMHLAAFLVFPIVFLFPNQLIVFMGESVGMDKYAEYGRGAIRGGANTFIFLIEALSLFCLVAIQKRNLIHDSTIKLFYTMAPLLTFFAPLIRSNGSMIRISLYYHLFLVFLVPFAIDCMASRRNRNLIYFIAIGALAFLTISNGGMRYYFYWQI